MPDSHQPACCPEHRAEKIYRGLPRVRHRSGAEGLRYPELLETILANWGINYLLGAQLVNRQLRDAVNSLVWLQRKLSLVGPQGFSVP